MKKNILSEIKKRIQKANKILLSTHIDPDGDTLGSMLALHLILKKMGKKPTMFSGDPVPDIYRFLPSVKLIKNLASPEDFDLIIALDAGSLGRLDPIFKNSGPEKIVNIDHHSDNTRYGKINYIAKVSCVGEQIYALAKHLKVSLDKNIGVCLYVAIMTDTGNFKYDNTTAETFAIAEEMLKLGVSPDKTANAVYENRSWPAIKLLAAALENAQSTAEGKIIYTVITKEILVNTAAHNQDFTGLIDHLRAIRGAEVAILIREDHEKNRVKINFRSKSYVDVQKISKELGGGGHSRAAGAIMHGDLLQIVNQVVGLTTAAL
ncbi:MAG: bifunctional oligoribonuclease/PAP phosphatase NrnA [Candidatus Saganbacteria bacterium]|nr:bifunctional oligoribonuclease/PAP phosphatase NrnA [Candidatus Saganbacteria bacterium]